METRIARMQELVRGVREVRNRYRWTTRRRSTCPCSARAAVADGLQRAGAVHHAAGRRRQARRAART